MDGRHGGRPLPVCELAVLGALGCAVAAVLEWGSPRGVWLIGAAVALACVGGLEVAVRDHLAGRRSHAWLLAGAAAVLASTAAFFVAIPPLAGLLAAMALLIGGGVALDRSFVGRRQRG